MTVNIQSMRSSTFFLRISMTETLQQLILTTLDAQGTIQDTRALVLPGQAQPATSSEDQITILGALNSLLSREVCMKCLV
jgi:hypothetical protein